MPELQLPLFYLYLIDSFVVYVNRNFVYILIKRSKMNRPFNIRMILWLYYDVCRSMKKIMF